MSIERSIRSDLALWFAALFLIGAAWICLLPPYEGVDEAGHYASIRQIAATGHLPVPGRSFVAQDTLDYAAAAPMPISRNAGAAFRFGRMDYRDFFAHPAAVAAYRDAPAVAAPRGAYRASGIDNWEAQHPPLYYLLMAPLVRATDALSVPVQFLILRLVSWTCALAGLALGLRGTCAMPGLRLDAAAVGRGTMILPLLAPVFVAEFARIGNDALCLLLMGWLWLRIARWLADPRAPLQALAVGCVLALGLLTKALFLPVLAGVAVWGFFATRGLYRHDRIEAVKAFAVPVCIALLWYLWRWRAFGAASGSLDEAWLAQHGGLMHGLAAHFDVRLLGHLILLTLYSWLFSGTASQVSPSLWWATPLVLANLGLFGAYAWQERRRIGGARALPLCLYGAAATALAYFILICVALDGTDRAPGWYLQTFAPAAAMIYATGLDRLDRARAWRRVMNAVLVYSGGLIAYDWVVQIALVTGCAAGLHGIAWANLVGHWSTPLMVFDRLEILAWPRAAILCLAGSAICFYRAMRLRSQHPL